MIGSYFAATVYYAIDNENYITVPFLLLFVVGYWYTGMMRLLQGRFGGAHLRSTTDTKPFPVGVYNRFSPGHYPPPAALWPSLDRSFRILSLNFPCWFPQSTE